MTSTLARNVGIAAAACSIALLGAGTAIAAPADATPVATGVACPDPPVFTETCTVSEDGLTLTRVQHNSLATIVEYYTSRGDLICRTESGPGSNDVFNIPCRTLVTVTRAFGSLSG